MFTVPKVSSRARNAPSSNLDSAQPQLTSPATSSQTSATPARRNRSGRSIRGLALVTLLAAVAGAGFAMHSANTTTELATNATIDDTALTQARADVPAESQDSDVRAIVPIVDDETPATDQFAADVTPVDVTPEMSPTPSQPSAPVVIPTSAPVLPQPTAQAPSPAQVVPTPQAAAIPEVALTLSQPAVPVLAPLAASEPQPAPPAVVAAPVPVLTVPASYSLYVSTNGCLAGGVCPFGPVPSNFYWAPTSTGVVFTGQSSWTHQHEACHAHQHLTIRQELGVEPAMPFDLHEWLSTSEGLGWAAQVTTAWPATGQWAREPGAHNAIEDFGISCGLYFSSPQELLQIDPVRYAAVINLLG